MSRKLLTGIAVLALCGGLAAGSIVPAGARAPAKTKVTIIPESGGFFGYVYSPKPGRCANGRVVRLYKQRGRQQKPSVDPKIGSDTAQANGDRFMWSTGNTGFQPGKFYARAGKVPGCRPDSSKSIPAEQ
jgi:hypothetical protein